MIVFHADHALLPAGIRAGVRVGVSDGLIRTVEEGPAQAGDVRIGRLARQGR